MSIIVLGASGFLGLNLVHALRDHGLTPTCVYRGRVPRMALRRAEVPTIPGDLDDLASLCGALQGATTVYHFAAHYPALSIDRIATLDLGRRQLDHVMAAAAQCGVQRLVFVSSIATVAAATAGLSTEEHTYAQPPGFGVYHDLKWLLEQQVLAEDRFATTVLCPGACLGPQDHRLGTSGMLVATARGLPVRHPDGWVNIVDARDVAEIAVRIATRDEMPDRLLISGSNHRLHDLLVDLAARYGVAPPPDALSAAEAIALANQAEEHAAASGERAAISRELVDLTVHGRPVDASLASRLSGHSYRSLEQTLTAFDQWARAKHIISSSPAATV